MLKNKYFSFISAKLQSDLIRNSFWGIFSNVLQNILFSIFFIVIARKYSTEDFASYILANTLYGFVVAFSSMGLGQWFVRELLTIEDKKILISKFFKIQLITGIFFYAVNILLSFILYSDTQIRQLSLLIGINVIFDNIIYVISFVNIAQQEQKKTFIIKTVEAFLKFLVAGLLFISNLPVLYLAFILILLRFVTLNLFIRIGSSNLINLKNIIAVRIDTHEVKKIIVNNWPFIVIGSVAVLYWRIGNILVSKTLGLEEVAIYEVSFKLFSMAQILPFIVSTSIFPMLVKAFNSPGGDGLRIYKRAFIAYTAYGLLSYTFIYSFSDFIIPFLFGEKYVTTPVYCREMFLTMLFFPTVLLQANLIVAIKRERTDMILNLLSLLVNVTICVTGLYYFKSLSVVNYAIFISFFVFHIAQDIFLLKKSMIKFIHAALFYLLSAGIVFSYQILATRIDKNVLFFIFWSVLLIPFAAILVKQFIRNKTVIPVAD